MRVGVTADGLVALERLFPDNQRGVALYDSTHQFLRYEEMGVVVEWAPWAFRGVHFFGQVNGVGAEVVVERRGRWAVGAALFFPTPGTVMMGVWLDDRLVAVATLNRRWRRVIRAAAMLTVGGVE